MSNISETNFVRQYLINFQDIKKLFQIGVPSLPLPIQNIVKKLVDEGARINANYDALCQKNKILKSHTITLHILSPSPQEMTNGETLSSASLLTEKENELLPADEKGEAIRIFAKKLVEAAKKNGELQKENKALEEELAKKYLIKPLATEEKEYSLSSSITPSPSSRNSSSPSLASISSSPAALPTPPNERRLHPSKDQEEADKRREKK
jgi:hypothetical protein